jgi:hypothetical protein
VICTSQRGHKLPAGQAFRGTTGKGAVAGRVLGVALGRRAGGGRPVARMAERPALRSRSRPRGGRDRIPARMESHEPYHHLPPAEWGRVARELQAEERRTGRVNYAAVPPSLPGELTDGEAGDGERQPGERDRDRKSP